MTSCNWSGISAKAANALSFNGVFLIAASSETVGILIGHEERVEDEEARMYAIELLAVFHQADAEGTM